MAGLNINSGASGNPLDALLGGRPLYGSLGGLLYGSPGANMPQATSEGGDPIYGEGYLYGNDPRYQQAYQTLQNQGLTQLRSTNIGGPGEAIDPSKVTYDPNLGLVTSLSNVKPVGNGTLWDQYGGFLMLGLPAAAAIAGGAAGSGAGAFEGASAGAEGVPGAFEGASAGAEGASGAAGLSGSPFEGASASASGNNGLLGNLMQGNFGDAASGAAQWAMDNPLRAAALLQTGYGLVQNGRSGRPGSSSGSKSSGGAAGSGLPLKNTAGSYQWTPNPYLLAQIGGRQ